MFPLQMYGSFSNQPRARATKYVSLTNRIPVLPPRIITLEKLVPMQATQRRKGTAALLAAIPFLIWMYQKTYSITTRVQPCLSSIVPYWMPRSVS